MRTESMPETDSTEVISETIIDFEDNSNVLVRYFVSPTFQLKVKPLPIIHGAVTTQYGQERVYDKRDNLDNWLKRNTIPHLALGVSQDIKSHLFFGGAPHQLSLCRIVEQRVFENYGYLGPAEGDYHRVIQILAMPANHGIPSSILDEFSWKEYYSVDEKNELVKRTQFV